MDRRRQRSGCRSKRDDDDAGQFAIEGKSLEDGDWHEFVNDYDLKVEGGVLRDTLDRSELKVFIKR